ncbi:protein FAM222A-like [Menidia menidia]
MLACIQRRQNFSSQRLACTPKSLDVPPPPLLLPAPPLQPCAHKGELASVISRYPSPAELDAFAQKTASSPLSIKIFPSDVRVPQHKQLSKTVNGLDTTGQRYSPYSHPHSGGYRGLLAIGKASAVVKGVVKTSEGRRTKQANSQASVAPYNNPANAGYSVRHGHKAYPISSCKPPEVPVETLCSTAGMAPGDQSLAPQPELAGVQGLMRRMSRVPHSQALQRGGEAGASPSLQAAAAAVPHSDSDFVLGVPPQSSLAYAGALPPAPGADAAKAGYLERGEYAPWQHEAPVPPPPPPQAYQQGALRLYAHGPFGRPPGGAGAVRDGAGGPSLAAGRYFAPLWDEPSGEGYSSQPGDHPHFHPGRHQQLHPPLPHARAYGAEPHPCCGPPGFGLCHAAALSSSLQSLECLINDIHPPCIKERMLGRGYQAMGMPQQPEHQQPTHIQLPVYR